MQHKLYSIEQLSKNFLPQDLPIMFLDLSIRTGKMIKTSTFWVVDFPLFIQRESPNVVFPYLTSVQLEFYVESMTVDCVGRVGCGCCVGVVEVVGVVVLVIVFVLVVFIVEDALLFTSPGFLRVFSL